MYPIRMHGRNAVVQDNREPGENPGRSRRCIGGAFFQECVKSTFLRLPGLHCGPGPFAERQSLRNRRNPAWEDEKTRGSPSQKTCLFVRYDKTCDGQALISGGSRRGEIAICPYLQECGDGQIFFTIGNFISYRKKNLRWIALRRKGQSRQGRRVCMR